MDVAVGGGRPPVAEQASRNVQTLAAHDRVQSVGMSQVVEPRVRHDPGDQIVKANTFGWKTELNQFANLLGDRLSADQI